MCMHSYVAHFGLTGLVMFNVTNGLTIGQYPVTVCSSQLQKCLHDAEGFTVIDHFTVGDIVPDVLPRTGRARVCCCCCCLTA